MTGYTQKNILSENIDSLLNCKQSESCHMAKVFSNLVSCDVARELVITCPLRLQNVKGVGSDQICECVHFLSAL